MAIRELQHCNNCNGFVSTEKKSKKNEKFLANYS